MSRKSWVYVDGVAYERGVDDIPVSRENPGCFIQGDIPDFVSPIDGSTVRGRAGMREHCKKHDVVPTQELSGLRTGYTSQLSLSKAEVRERREYIAHQVTEKLQG